MDFQKGRVKWLTPRLTKTFTLITQPVAIENTFVMSFLDNFSRWSKVDTKNQRPNPTKINFETVNRKIRKKGHADIYLFYQ